jgi:hypothetical protein
MEALPRVIPPDGHNMVAGIVCPDCAGVIQVRRMGTRGHLEFTCRIGHLYSLPELLAAKERDLEHRAWAAVLAAEEMHALMRDLIDEGEQDPDTMAAFTERLQTAKTLTHRLREAVEHDRPVRLKPGEVTDAHTGEALA